jgi:ribonuclease Y
MDIMILVGVLVGLVAGFAGAWVLSNSLLKTRKDGILSEAMKEGETIKEKKILQAKERFLELKSQHEKEVHERNNKVKQGEDRIRNREKELSQQSENLKKKEKEVENWNSKNGPVTVKKVEDGKK